MEAETPAVEFRAVAKRFGEVQANRRVDFSVAPGTIHAIIGENGAGKSTAMKMLYGMFRPDEGEILVRGAARAWRSPRDAIACGIGMVHQHFMLAEPWTVLENILLGAEPAKRAWRLLPRILRPIDRAAARARLDSISGAYGLKLDPDARVGELSVGIQQRIEIVKLLYREAGILILDEPTAVLTPGETAELFVQLRKLRAQGKTVLIITHKLKEVLELADEATIFRAGEVVGHRKVAATDADELASLMVGRRVALRAAAPPPPRLGPPVLEAKGLCLEGARLRELSFAVRSGEIVGIAGVEGNGQSDLLQVLLHPREFARRLRGSVTILGKTSLGLSTEEIRKLGVGFVPEDRHREGLLLERALPESYLLGFQRRAPYSRRGILSDSAIRGATLGAIDAYDVRPRRLAIDAGKLSGGNQQKLIIARELQGDPRLLVVAQPTRGVDVGAIELIHGRILEARARGAGILLVSSELDEILALSDRILVMYEGRFAAEFSREEAEEKAIGVAMSGGGAPPAEVMA